MREYSTHVLEVKEISLQVSDNLVGFPEKTPPSKRLGYGRGVAVLGTKSSVGTGGGWTLNPSSSVIVKYVT